MLLVCELDCFPRSGQRRSPALRWPGLRVRLAGDHVHDPAMVEERSAPSAHCRGLDRSQQDRDLQKLLEVLLAGRGWDDRRLGVHPTVSGLDRGDEVVKTEATR